ncbi:hypothetical protein NRB20_04940 [Nocardia sp. RB20]|uniref:Uncharacterized protein n=1 Tax=Nocardia macrotermitis TaxID=2585198 RepID=A0A7K0CV94_9NOCA|nr:hypothetical protein [Nocardia macrotermitis]
MLQLVSANDVDSRQLAALYVGADSWSLPWLPGRTVDTEVAAAAVGAGAALLQRPSSDDPVWVEIHRGAALLGVSARELAEVLDVLCVVPDQILECRQGRLRPQLNIKQRNRFGWVTRALTGCQRLRHRL